MIESILSLFIYVLILGLVFAIAVWVLGLVGIAVPQRIVQIIAAIIFLLILLSFFGGYITPLPMFGRHG